MFVNKAICTSARMSTVYTAHSAAVTASQTSRQRYTSVKKAVIKAAPLIKHIEEIAATHTISKEW